MSEKQYPGTCTVARPEIYNIQAMPTQPTTLKPGQLPESKIKDFFEKGFIHLENFFSVDELDQCLNAIEGILDDVATLLHKNGKIKDLHKETNVFQRLMRIEEEFPDASILVHKHGILPQAFRNLWTNERLLNVMEQILGGKVCANPVWNIRPKVPSNPNGDVPWHQDSGYFDPASYGTLIPVAWVPLLDANENNGCLQIIEGGHRRGLVTEHLNCWANTWYAMINEDKMEKTLGTNVEKDIRTLPVKKGGLLLFNNLIPHRSLPNKDDMCRWSLDLRFQRPGEAEGLYGALPPVLLRDTSNPALKADWSPYDANRHTRQRDMTETEGWDKTDAVSTILTGPWMKQWPLVNSNRHTEAAGLTLETER